MFTPTHIIVANDATGRHVAHNAFAYQNTDVRCILVGHAYEATIENEHGMRQKVELTDHTFGYVWEDELEPICNGCVGCWQCDP